MLGVMQIGRRVEAVLTVVLEKNEIDLEAQHARVELVTFLQYALLEQLRFVALSTCQTVAVTAGANL